jgi:hypothetical protein
MEAQKSSKYPGSKFAEGRLKLSTACTECHKRKQKVCLQKIADLGNVLYVIKIMSMLPGIVQTRSSYLRELASSQKSGWDEWIRG